MGPHYTLERVESLYRGPAPSLLSIGPGTIVGGGVDMQGVPKVKAAVPFAHELPILI